MSGTPEQGKKSAATKKKLYGENIHAVYGAKGGSTPTKFPKGFAYMAIHDPERLKRLAANRKKKG